MKLLLMEWQSINATSAENLFLKGGEMTAKNDVTGDSLISKVATDKFRDNFDRIFRSKPEPVKVREAGLCADCGASLEGLDVVYCQLCIDAPARHRYEGSFNHD